MIWCVLTEQAQRLLSSTAPGWHAVRTVVSALDSAPSLDAGRAAVPGAVGSRRARCWRALCLLMALGGGLYLAALAWIYCYQEELIFQPEPLPAAHRFALADVREVEVDVGGTTLSALHLRLPAAKGVVFFLHGNNGNLASWFTSTDVYRAANYDLFMLDYRSYGKSGGRIESEEQLRDDVLAAWRVVAPQYAGKPKVVFGRSLGTALAAGLAAEVQPELTILVSPYCSMTQLMQAHYPLLPAVLLRYPLATCADAARLRGEVLLVHGEQDRLIPIEHSERLLSVVPQARLLRLPAAAHGDVHRFPAYTEELLRTLRAL